MGSPLTREFIVLDNFRVRLGYRAHIRTPDFFFSRGLRIVKSKSSSRELAIGVFNSFL
jgi:hypothetical protein